MQFKSDHDHLNVEVYLSDAQMEPLVLGITANRPGLMKTMKSLPDIKAFTRKLEVGRDRLPQWPSDQLSIQAEQAQIFYDLMPGDDAMCCPACDNLAIRQAAAGPGECMHMLCKLCPNARLSPQSVYGHIQQQTSLQPSLSHSSAGCTHSSGSSQRQNHPS